MSWGLWASAAYDYPADTRGYTYGIAGDLSVEWWSIRAGLFLEPKQANGMELEWDVGKARGLVTEVEARRALLGRPAAVRVLAFLNTARMGSYRRALDQASGAPDVTAARAEGRTKAGLAASGNVDLGGGRGAFLRISWNDGRNESWAFTEIDRSLAAGGYGFIIGDGRLRYAPEVLIEAYYRCQLTREVSLGFDYQPIFDPGYDRDRGPVQVFTGRAHVAF